MGVERVDVAQNLPRFLELLGVEHAAAHHEADRPARVHHIATDAPVQVFLAGDGRQHFAGHGVVDILLQHPFADLFELVVNAFENVGRIFCVGVIELEQHILGVFDHGRNAPGAQAQQPEYRQILVVDREQHIVQQDEGNAHIARRFVIVDQEVRADMQLAVVFLVETR